MVDVDSLLFGLFQFCANCNDECYRKTYLLANDANMSALLTIPKSSYMAFLGGVVVVNRGWDALWKMHNSELKAKSSYWFLKMEYVAFKGTGQEKMVSAEDRISVKSILMIPFLAAALANMRGWVCNKLAGCRGDWKCGDGRIVGKDIVLAESTFGQVPSDELTKEASFGGSGSQMSQKITLS
ncbi:homology to ABI1 [Prunus dulcis]|uniref:Homology to ABI1 n=1 Tax=Prunus dulcis TaxID=3755 RepID=A0A5H2XJV8_PRUDU|nr:homology to ABI1 [Prunus dulcis]